jgi:hypothetical protein
MLYGGIIGDLQLLRERSGQLKFTDLIGLLFIK